jgi:hypothetical protein
VISYFKNRKAQAGESRKMSGRKIAAKRSWCLIFLPVIFLLSPDLLFLPFGATAAKHYLECYLTATCRPREILLKVAFQAPRRAAIGTADSARFHE